jgi:hypothetical protein
MRRRRGATDWPAHSISTGSCLAILKTYRIQESLVSLVDRCAYNGLNPNPDATSGGDQTCEETLIPCYRRLHLNGLAELAC